MLRQFCLSRNLIILPPPPGGVAVLGYFHQFLSLGDKKIFGKNLGQAKTFEMFFGRISAIFGQITAIEISKIWDFGHFWPNLDKFRRLFFFQNEILVQNCPEMTKNDFRHLLWIPKMVFMYSRVIFGDLKIWLFHMFCKAILSWKTEMSQHVHDNSVNCMISMTHFEKNIHAEPAAAIDMNIFHACILVLFPKHYFKFILLFSSIIL